MFSYFKRKKAQARIKDAEIIADFDALVTQPVYFSVLGTKHEIAPLDFETFLKAMNACAALDLLRVRTDVKDSELLKAYKNVFEVMCPSVLEDFHKLQHSQIAGIMNLVIEMVMGKAQVEAEKKSRQMNQVKTNQAGF